MAFLISFIHSSKSSSSLPSTSFLYSMRPSKTRRAISALSVFHWRLPTILFCLISCKLKSLHLWLQHLFAILNVIIQHRSFSIILFAIMSQQSWVCILHVNVNHYFICNCLTFLPTPWNESASEITFSGVQGREINRVPILDVQTLFKERETFQHTNFYSRHPPSVKRGYVKGERYASWEQLSDALR